MIDLSQTEFADSSVIHRLFSISEAPTYRGRRLAQLGSASGVRRALEITELPTDAIVASRKEALVLASSGAVPA